ncbi:MAG: hypothetical protein ACJ718_02895 [Nitrososphaeraceae archaeon]
MIIITNFRPIKCSKGYFRAEIRHGISGVTQWRTTYILF